MKKLLMLLLSTIIAFSAVACGGVEYERDDITYLRIIAPNNGLGISGIEQLAKDFEELHTDTEFAPGKKGVIVQLKKNPEVVFTSSIARDGYHVYINPYRVDAGMIPAGNFLNIDSIVKEPNPYDNGKTIDSKIPEEAKQRFTGKSDKHGEGYYFLPSVSYEGGLTYDKHLFDEKGYYFLAEEEGEYFYSDFTGREVYFADIYSDLYTEAIDADDDWNGWNSNRYFSCGPDGIYETYDDGMPSSLEELVILCEKMSGEGVKPFVLSGKYPENFGYVADGMLNALLRTEENMLAMKNFTASEFEIVTGYEPNSELWGQSYIQVPKTAKVPVTESQGYYTTWSAAKYYTAAFWKLAVAKKWFAKSVETDASHIGAQADFIFSGYDKNRDRSAFLIEGSYWFNESTERKNFVDFDKFKATYGIGAKEREKQLKWYSIPREISGTVTEGNGTPEAFMNLGFGAGNLYNAIFKDDPEAMAVIREWILFYFSDESQKYLMNSTGLNTIMEIEGFDPSLYDDRPFYKDYLTRQTNGALIKPIKVSKIASNYPDIFLEHGWDTCWTDLKNPGECNLYTGFKVNNYSVKFAFEYAMINRQGWGGIWQDSASDGMPATFAKDENGNEIVYNG